MNIESFLFNVPIIDLDCYFICFNVSHYFFNYFFLITFTYKCYLFLICDLIYFWTDITGHRTLLCHTSELLSHFSGQLTSLCGHSVLTHIFRFFCLFIHFDMNLCSVYECSLLYQYFSAEVC